MKRTPVSDLELQAIIKAEVQNADGYSATQVSGERAENLDYYFGRPFGNEIEGRSSVVSTDVRETVEWLMPTLMRVFTSGEDVVAFKPETEQDTDAAKQATEYVNYIWTRDNSGFLNLYSWFKDALISKNGIIKIWWDDTPKQKRERYSGLDDATYSFLVADKSVSVAEHTERKEQIPLVQIDPTTGQEVQSFSEEPVHDVVITREVPGGKVCVHPVPPEEFLISKEARDIEMARLVGHRTRVTLSDLREQGVSEEVLSQLSSDDASVMTDAEETKRNTVENITAQSTTTINASMRQVWRTEAYIKIDVDGDGIAEMRKVTVVGSQYAIISNEAWEGPRPFATLTPIILPHRFFGLAIADLGKDLQLIRSTIWRQMLDNLYLSNNAREEVVAENIIDPDELLSSAPGRKIRVKSLGSIQPIAVPDVISGAMEMMQYTDQVLENRTGVSDRTQGLADSALQKTAREAQMQMTAAMGKVELIARCFAETGVKEAFRLILKLICMYQDKARTVELTRGWVTMDPSGWNEDMHMQTQVALGMGDRDQQLGYAQLIGAAQEKLMQLGFVSPEDIKNATEVAINAMGYRGVDRFFTFPQGQAATQPIPPPPPKQTGPAPVNPQVEQMKAEIDAEAKVKVATVQANARAQTDTHRITMEAARDAQQQESDFKIEGAKLTTEQLVEIITAHIRAAAQIESARIAAKADDGADAYAREASGETMNG